MCWRVIQGGGSDGEGREWWEGWWGVIEREGVGE